MIISQGRNYIFVHAPKTGGTSLAFALETRAKKDDILIGNTPKAQNRRRRQVHLQAQAAGRLWKHSTLRDSHGVISETFMDEAFVFTLVRNPWDRMVSYYHWLQMQDFDHLAVHLAETLSFSEFLNEPRMQRAIQNSPYEMYTLGTDRCDKCNLYIRLEHLAEDIAPLEEHLGFKLDVPHLNTSRREGDWHGHYSESDAALLAKLCAADIEKFGYRFD